MNAGSLRYDDARRTRPEVRDYQQAEREQSANVTETGTRSPSMADYCAATAPAS